MIAVEKLSICYGKRPIVSDISFTVERGEIAALVGPNGAGKTTILRAIGGIIRPVQGTITINGSRTERWHTQEMVRHGVVYVPEGMSVFPQMSVEENLEVGAYTHREKLDERLAKVFQLLPELREKRKLLAGNLSGGEQRMVTIGRGLMAGAVLLLLDDPFLGLSPKLTNRFCEIFRTLRDGGKTIIIAGQHVRRLLHVANIGFLIEDGHLSLKGSGEELLGDPHLRQVLFGYHSGDTSVLVEDHSPR